MKLYIIAGEASGDMHGANLLKELRLREPNLQVRCWGGGLMEAQGAEVRKHYKELAFMGFVQVLANIRTILKNFKLCKADILDWNPDAVILIDYPGFNLRMAKFVHDQGVQVLYYISPTIWAWKESRIKQIKAYVDRMCVILPFEKPFYAKFDYEVDYVGHPILDAIHSWNENNQSSEVWRKQNNLSEKPIIALLPGSRKQEISTMLKVMLQLPERFPDYQFVVAGAPGQSLDYYRKQFGNSDVKIVQNDTYNLLRTSHAAVVTSGTATLETALFRVPEVVCYKANTISYYIARLLIKVKYISLVNLVLDREAVKELIQFDFNVAEVSDELTKILDGDGRKKMLQDYDDLINQLGRYGASAKAANAMLKTIGRALN